MASGARYLVGRRRRFNEHAPNTIFEACLDPAHEARAVARGDITVLERFKITLAHRSYKLPSGWANPTKEQ